MKRIQKQGVLNTVITYFGIGLGFVNNVLLFTNFFQAEEYGLTRVLVNATLLFSQISCFGTSSSLLRFYPSYKSNGDLPKMVLSIAGIVLMATAVVGLGVMVFEDLIIEHFAENASLFNSYVYLLLPLIALTTLNSTLVNYFNAGYHTVLPTMVVEVVQRLMVTINIGAYYFQLYDFTLFMELFVASYLVSTLIYFLNIKDLQWRDFANSSCLPRFKDVLFHIKYSAFALLSGTANTITLMIDTIMIGMFVGLAEAGIYSTAAYLVSTIMVPSRALHKISLPTISTYIGQQAYEKADVLLKKSALTLVVIGGAVFLLLSSALDLVYSLMKPAYASGEVVFYLLFVSRLFYMVFGMNGQVIRLTPKYKVDSMFTVLFALSTILFNYYFIQAFGMEGAAMATISSVAIYFALSTGYLQFRFKLSPITPRILIALMWLIGCFAVLWYIPKANSLWVNTIIQVVGVVLPYSLVAYFSKLSPELNELVEEQLTKLGLLNAKS